MNATALLAQLTAPGLETLSISLGGGGGGGGLEATHSGTMCHKYYMYLQSRTHSIPQVQSGVGRKPHL